MLKRLICWLWGHKVIVKAFTGEMIQRNDPFAGGIVDAVIYKWEKQKFCLRCGKDNAQ